MYTKKLSVLVPCFNEERHIGLAIQSLINQKFDDVQFLISDNCSTDNTFSILKQYAEADSRIVLFQQTENIGASGNAKFLLSQSHGEYFFFFGAHDYISDNFIACAIDILDRNKDICMVTGTPMAINEQGKVIGKIDKAIYDFTQDTSVDRYLKSVNELYNCTCFQSIFRASALGSYSITEVQSADHIFISRLLWFGKLHYMENQQYYRRYFKARNESSAERVTGKDTYLSFYDFINQYLKDFNKLYEGTPPLRDYINRKIIDSLVERSPKVKLKGLACLMPNDGLD